MFAPRARVVRRRPLLRAAAVGGTFAAGRATGRRAQERASAEQDQGQPTSGQTSQAPASQGDSQAQYQGQASGGQAASSPSVLDQLNQLTALHQQGSLSDEEFAAAKAQVLRGS